MEERIQFEVSKLAFQKGFDISGDYCYDTNGVLKDNRGDYDRLQFMVTENQLPAPTQNLLKTWLRKKYNIHVEVEFECEDSTYYVSIAGDYLLDNYGMMRVFFTYEEALEELLLEGLKRVKNDSTRI